MGKRHVGIRSIVVAGVLVCLLGAAGPIPPSWTEADIGSPGQAGSSSWDPVTDVWAVNVGGGDIWGTADQLHYMSRTVSGDCELVAKVQTQAPTNVWAKAGVMIRETTAAGSSYAFAAATPGNGMITQWRASTGGSAGGGGGSGGTVPYWVRLTRVGNVFTGYSSPDGTTWTQTGQVTITMSASVQAGLAVTSHDNTLRSDCTFSNFTVNDGTGTVIWPLAPPTGLMATNNINSVTLDWTASTSAATTGYTILRGTANGGPYTALPGGTTAGVSFTDNSASNPNTYYYVVIATNATSQSMYSNQAQGDPLPPPVTALPNTGLFTNENGATTTFTVHFNAAAPAGGSLVTILSSNTAEGVVTESAFAYSAAGGNTGIQFTVPAGFTGDIPITVTGVDDNIVDGPTAYNISVTASNMSVTIPDVNVTNNDNDTPGITFSKTGGLVTTESGGTDSFSVVLNTQPYGTITMLVSSSNTAEAVVSTGSLTFTNANWNVPQVVTVTGVDDNVLDFTVPYTIVTGALTYTDSRDAGYASVPTPDLSGVNLDNEAIPALPHVWGGKSSGSGGCGLTGLEAALLLALVALRRVKKQTG